MYLFTKLSGSLADIRTRPVIFPAGRALRRLSPVAGAWTRSGQFINAVRIVGKKGIRKALFLLTVDHMGWTLTRRGEDRQRVAGGCPWTTGSQGDEPWILIGYKPNGLFRLDT